MGVTTAKEALVPSEAQAGAPARVAADAARRFAAAGTAVRGWLPQGRTLPAADWRIRHRWLLALLGAHAVALPLFGLSRGYSVAHTLLEGSAIAVPALLGATAPLAPRWRAAISAFGLVTSSAVLVHLSGGVIEAHFHFFVVIIILTLYEDWLPFLISLGYVVAHHGILGTVSPESVYNHSGAFEDPWRWALIHGAFVAAAGAGAIVSWRLNESTRAHAAEAVAQAVRSEEASELKSRFIATTSHELRTPLTSIGGFATTLRHRWDDIADGDKVQLLEIIEAQTQRLRSLIDDLLLLAAAESGKLTLRRRAIDVREAVDAVVRELPSTDGVHVAVERGLTASVDERHFAQVLTNYVTNAQKYGAPPITIAAQRDRDWVEVSVADSGDGVPERFAPRLFEAFSRGVDDRPVHGSGLGLSIVEGLVQAHGGEAWYEPNRPRGACFKARFPDAAG